jgi:hypothetical protein
MSELTVLPGELSICRLPAESGIPAWAAPGEGAVRGDGAPPGTGSPRADGVARSPLTSVVWTADETSVVCASVVVPGDVRASSGWLALQVLGPLDLGLTGILASLARPLAEAGLALFTVSTYDTDYVLVKASSLEPALAALRAAGHIVRQP